MMGKVTEVLGEKHGSGYGSRLLSRTHQIPQEWPEAVDKQIENLGEHVPGKEKQRRTC
ncbi:hypothetical protein O9992_10675 [Vibrio lentus]|nr:hypothetical protein [Vibrio lentus]